MVCILKCFSENKWILFIKWIEPCCVLHGKISVLVNLLPHCSFFHLMLGEENKYFSIYSSQMVFQFWIKQALIWTIWIHRNKGYIHYAHAEGASSVKNQSYCFIRFWFHMLNQEWQPPLHWFDSTEILAIEKQSWGSVGIHYSITAKGLGFR